MVKAKIWVMTDGLLQYYLSKLHFFHTALLTTGFI